MPFAPSSSYVLSLVAFIANAIYPDQTALIRVHSVCFHGKSILKCDRIFAANVKVDEIFRTNNIGRIRVIKLQTL